MATPNIGIFGPFIRLQGQFWHRIRIPWPWKHIFRHLTLPKIPIFGDFRELTGCVLIFPFFSYPKIQNCVAPLFFKLQKQFWPFWNPYTLGFKGVRCDFQKNIFLCEKFAILKSAIFGPFFQKHPVIWGLNFRILIFFFLSPITTSHKLSKAYFTFYLS